MYRAKLFPTHILTQNVVLSALIRGLLLFFFFCCLSTNILAQIQLNGKVLNTNNEPLFAANVFLKSNPQSGTISDFEGNFQLQIKKQETGDTLVVSFIGFKQQEVVLENPKDAQDLTINLEIDDLVLNELVISGKAPISEQFSLTRLDAMDVYLNPIAAGDPLKAITSLAASTNTEETANPSLRGSDAERSRVILNGVPIYRPVRNSQINGIGFFSLFSTELMENMYVYAGNPPLTIGNSSAGLVEVEVKKEVEQNNFQFSAGLANIGFFATKKVGKTHMRWYGNVQNSGPFLWLNGKRIPNLKRFQNTDMGFSIFRQLNRNLSVQLFSYGIDESALVEAAQFTYQGLAAVEKKRNFNVLNFKYAKGKSKLSFNHGSNFSRSSYHFGNIVTGNRNMQWYHSLNYEQYLTENWKIQAGITHDNNRYKFSDSIPQFFFAIAENAPTFFGDTSLFLHQLEPYLYTSWDNAGKWVLSAGIRTNIPLYSQERYTSYQGGIRYKANKMHSFLLGAGRYHSYTMPNFYGTAFELLQSKQLSLDYEAKWDKTIIKAAVYLKEEKGNQQLTNELEIQKTNILGFELEWNQLFGKYFSSNISNTFVQADMESDGIVFKGNNSLNYFLKANIQFNHPKLINLAIAFLARPGKFFTPVESAIFRPNLDLFEPIQSSALNSQQFENYQRLDLSVNKALLWKKTSVILYATISNIFNKENQRSVIYKGDYTANQFDFYQQLTFYFGSVWRF